MTTATWRRGLACVVLYGLVGCSEKAVEPANDGGVRRYADGVSAADSALALQGKGNYRLGISPNFSAVPAPPGTRQCMTLSGIWSPFDPKTYKVGVQLGQVCATTYEAVPQAWHTAEEGLYYTGDVTFTFSQPVYSMTIYAYGAFSCSGSDFGHARAYDPNGNLVDLSDFIIIDPEGDCGADDVGGGRTDTVRSAGPIKSITFTAPVPFTWQLPSPYNLTGRISASYYVSFYERPCPPLDDQVLDHPPVRDSLLKALATSRPTLDGVGRREHGGYVHIGSDGVPFLIEEMQSGFPNVSLISCASPLSPPSLMRLLWDIGTLIRISRVSHTILRTVLGGFCPVKLR